MSSTRFTSWSRQKSLDLVLISLAYSRPTIRRERKIKKMPLREFPLFLLSTFWNRKRLFEICYDLAMSCSAYAATLHVAIALALIALAICLHLVLHRWANSWLCTHRRVRSLLLPCVIGSHMTPCISCPHYLEHLLVHISPLRALIT